jgi:putative transposase
MTRSVRVEFPGAFYHVMARGNRREPIFLDKEDGKQFVKALGEKFRSPLASCCDSRL